MLKGQDKKLALGQAIDILRFKDGNPRACYPCTLIELEEMNLYLSNINEDSLIETIQSEIGFAALTWLLQKSFMVTDKKQLREILDNIDESNYADIISDIKEVSGISDISDSSNNNDSEPLDWSTSVCAITTYTSLTIEDIKKLTLTQFNSLLEFINKKIMFEYKYTTVGYVKDSEDYIENKDYPLHGKEKEKTGYTTLKDIANMQRNM